ncbi:hypothetical protein OEZ86_012366 [Tetradesmus obliquus]|nr:hypothetical protein OEZ86_012366 [Tetradesmus obliquus]
MGVGCMVLLLHLPTMKQRWLPGRDGGGVAAVAVHPSRQHFLVAERCKSRPPAIYIYAYPSLELVQTLAAGTERSYSCAVFSPDGAMLASVGSSPDYLLTLWDWASGATLLRCKAFSQEVYAVRFSPHFAGSLVTCGTGHIRFWRMADTFTGLKLQGDLGKFGSLELSDVAAFVELPDGQVLSSSESGSLLLWDGGLVKAVIARPGGAPCHAGPVEVLLHDSQSNYVVSGGGDGVLRLWDAARLADAEPGEGGAACQVRPAAEVVLPGGGCPRGLLWQGRSSWLVLSDCGALLRVALPLNLLDSKGFAASRLLELHAGGVLGAYTCPDRHVVITAAGSGAINAISYRSGQALQQRQFSSRATCMAMLPVSADAEQRTAVLGFADGSLRLLRLCADGWRLLAAVKPYKVLECSWDHARPLSSTTAMADAAVTAVSSSWSGSYALLGSADGAVRLEGRHTSNNTWDGRHWQCPLHGLRSSPVTALAMAFDDSCFISAAKDGSLLLLSNPLHLQPAEAANAAAQDLQLPSMAADAAAAGGLADAPDLQQDAPSLEEARQAAQHSQQAAAAAAAREQLVAAVAVLRREHAALVAENNARPPGQQLPRHMLDIDAGLDALVEQERAALLADAKAQVAYDAELAQLRLRKLQAYYTASLAVHHLTLHALRSGSSVSTIRQAELPKELLLSIQEAEQEEAAQQQLRQDLSRQLSNTGSASKKGSAHLQELAGDADPSRQGLPGQDASSMQSRAELWRQSKKARAAEWAAFNASRPDETYEAPADLAALAEAAATIGDYKLKSDAGYVLPEDQRLTPSRKRSQMLLLVRDMTSAQSSFNARVLALRDEKRGLLARLNAARQRLSVINNLLGITEPLPELHMLPEEEPEQQLQDVSEAQVAEHHAAKKAAADKAAGTTAGGLGGFAGAKAGPSKQAAADAHKQAGAGGSAAAAKQPGGASSADAVQRSASEAGAAPATLSHTQLRTLHVERQHLLDDITRQCAAFAASIAAARTAQLELGVGIKAAEGQLLTMTRELAVLQEAEVQELVLEGKRAAKAAEQAELAGGLAEVGRVLDAKRAEGDAAAARRAAVVAELEVLLADQDAFREQLTKVFNRRIKRSRRHGAGDGSGSSDSEDSGCEGGSDSGSDDEAGEEVCPPGCEPGLYERVVELRGRRLDEEEAGGEVGKALEGIRKERELLGKKARLLEQALAAVNQSVLEFQQEKQARLNQLPAVVSLRLHQVEFLEGRRLPHDLSGAVVFSQQQLGRLKQRMQELDEERAALRQQQKELRRQHHQLQADKAAKQGHLAELSAKCRDVQMLKFGQVIDVALLDTIGVRNRAADELREALKQQLSTGTRELAEWDAKIAAKRRELLALSRENTTALNTVTELTRTQRELEAAVMAGRSALWSDPLDARRAAVAERDKLVATINSRAGRLDSLRSQIAALKWKDTSVYS